MSINETDFKTALQDDGAALRLAVAYELLIAPGLGMTVVGPESGRGEISEPHGSDPMAATRRAIVAVARAVSKLQTIALAA